MRTKAVLGLCAAGALVFTACGSDKKSSSTTAAAATTVAAATTAAGGTAAGTTAAGSTPASGSTAGSTATTAGGTATTVAPTKADPSKSAITVGFHNLEGGAISLPEVKDGFESGLNYVNEELGGVNGHQLKADYCKTDVTPESSVNCANTFVQNNDVLAVQGVDPLADAALPILKQAGIIELGFFSFSPAMNHAVGDAYFTLFSNEEGYAADLLTQKSLGAKSEAVVQSDLPSAHAALTDVIQPAADKIGIKVIPFFYPTQADWTTFAATILASNPDSISLTAAQDADCLAAVPALRSAGFTGVIHASSCSQIITDLDPKVLNNVISHNEFYYPTFTSIPPKPQSDIDTFMKYIKRDHPDFKSLVYTELGFHIAVQAADMLRQVPGDSYTAATVKAEMGKTKGSEFFRDSTYDCSKPTWPGTTACGGGLIFTKVTADRKKEVLPNQPVDVSAYLPAG